MTGGGGAFSEGLGHSFWELVGCIQLELVWSLNWVVLASLTFHLPLLHYQKEAVGGVPLVWLVVMVVLDFLLDLHLVVVVLIVWVHPIVHYTCYICIGSASGWQWWIDLFLDYIWWCIRFHRRGLLALLCSFWDHLLPLHGRESLYGSLVICLKVGDSRVLLSLAGLLCYDNCSSPCQVHQGSFDWCHSDKKLSLMLPLIFLGVWQT